MADEIDADSLPFVPPANVTLIDTSPDDLLERPGGKPTTAFHDWLTSLWGRLKQLVVDLQTKITTVESSTDDAHARITTEIIARTTADSALASQITTIEASVGDNAAAIVNEATARANADSAIATQITSLTATVGSNTAAISAEATARANGDSALASSISSLSATVSSNTAAISSEATTRASADSALSSSISTVSAVANSATASGQIFFGAKSAPTGATASYGMFLTAGSAFAGIEAIAKSGGGAAIGFTADKFVFIDAGNLQEVFTYIGSGRWVLNGSISFRSSVGTTTLEISNQGVFINDPSTSSSIELSIT